jgi:hypothetical protein
VKVKDLWHEEFRSPDGKHCGLCGNNGFIDTRGLKTPAGYDAGGVYWCICPNGRAMKKAGAKLPGGTSGDSQ